MHVIDHIIQFVILVCSIITAFLLPSRDRQVRRVAFAIGLCAQPFWFITAHRNGQWAILILSIWFTFNHWRGFRNNSEPTVEKC